MPFLLDTNIMSDIIHRPKGLAARRFRHHPLDQIMTSIVVAAELRFGMLRKSASIQQARLAELFNQLPVVPFETPADLFYAELRVELERRGTPIGANDMLIAAHALALDCVLVTANEREFRRVPDLRVENWLA
ncbi:MAG TPA: type II toxin-antitoxin system VapC family toxin [Allosphingosinicella sp.]|jgi:tRNA(fMet)-specific endonuclease VapC